MRDYLNDRPIKLRGDRAPATPARLVALAVVFCLIALGLVLLDQRGVLAPARGLLQQGISPAARQLTALRDRIGDFFSGITDVQQLRAENAALQQRVSELESETIRLEQARLENTRLHQQLAIQETQPWTLLGADIVVRTPDAGRRVMTIARGSRDGVRAGMAVIGQTGSGPTALVGIVEATGPRTADVLLITDFGSHVSAWVQHEDRAILGLVQGQWQLGSRLRLEQVARDAALRAGDRVVSAGLTGLINEDLPLARVPPYIPIGVVETVIFDGHAQVAELRPYVDPDHVRYTWVILNHDE